MIKKILVLSLLVLLLIPGVFGLTAAVRGKATISVEASPEDPVILERTLYIENRNEIPVKVTIFNDGIYDDFLDFDETEVNLEPDESRDISYKLTIDRGGNFDVKINVAFEPAEADTGENKVGVPIVLTIRSKGPEIPLPEPEEDEPDTPEYVEGTPQEGEGNFSLDIGLNKPPEETQEKDSDSSLIFGMIIIFIIILIGLTIFFIILKLLK